MGDKLVIAVLGTRESGKSKTWNAVFDIEEEGITVRTGAYIRSLYLNAAEWVDVFLVAGSSEERGIYIGDILPKELPPIVLCSMQYHEDVKDTIRFFVDNHYDFLVIWLNPGYHDSGTYNDDLQLISRLLTTGAYIAQRSGKGDLRQRSLEIRQFLYGWAKIRNLIKIEF
jgi:hypothetical protein